MNLEIHGKQALVLGLGTSGKAAAAYLQKRNCRVKGADRTLQPADFPTFLDRDLSALEGVDFLVASPGVDPEHPLLVEANNLLIPVVGETELGAKELQASGKFVIGVTGTNGKTTVTRLLEHLFNAAGKKALAVGNVGLPLTAALDEASADVFVMELSSFQLESLFTKILDAALLLNITPDHLDRHKSLNAYARAKIRIQDALKINAPFWVQDICYAEWKELFGSNIPKTFGFMQNSDLNSEKVEYILPEEYRNRRNHDLLNILAAFAVFGSYCTDPQVFTSALSQFRKPPHRVEYVCERRGVRFFDDSKGTNVDAVIKAVEALDGRVLLIAGGVDKGFPYTQWPERFQDKVAAVFAIGQAAQSLERDLAAYLRVTRCGSLEEAVLAAVSQASAGDNILLSPGCASYDMFKDYAHRGDEFQRIVRSLQG